MNFKKKIIIQTVIYTIIVELFTVIILGGVLYFNYEKLSAADSGVYKDERLVLKDIPELEKKLEVKNTAKIDKGVLYEGKFGKVVKNYTKRKDDKHYLERTFYSYHFDEDKLQKAVMIKYLLENKLLDKFIADYFLNLEGSYTEEFGTLMNYYISIKKISSKDAEKYINGYTNDYNKILAKLNKLIEDNDFILLAEKLAKLDENSFLDNTKFVKPYENTILQDQRSKYVLNQLLTGEYHNDIEKVAKIFDIDEKLLVSSIAVEQLRFLTTNRAYAKKLIKDNVNLTMFSKFSYGVGGIKVLTSRKIQESVKTYNQDIYNKYFIQDFGLTDAKLINKLEDDFGGILYAGGLIYSIENRWKNGGFSLSSKPGVVVTLYNMGNPKKKNPHNNPDMGGSILNIDGKKRYFGEIGELFYYYLKYYIAK